MPANVGEVDELEEYLTVLLTADSEFRAAYEAAVRWQRRAYPGKLAVDGHAYQRRLAARRRRR